MHKTSIRFSSLAIAALLLLTLSAGSLQAQPAGPADAIRTVTAFLDLSEQQAQLWADIRATTGEAIQPVAEELAIREAQLGELLGGENPDPAVIGGLVLASRTLRLQILGLRQAAAAEFRQILSEGQGERLQALTAAAPLCPVLPAFRAVGLI